MTRSLQEVAATAQKYIRDQHRGAASCYSDGGLIGPKNPSVVGGTWAWVMTDENGVVIDQRAGAVVSASAPLPAKMDRFSAVRWMQEAVTNNQTELHALVQALTLLPDGWAGAFYCDSQNALYRAFGGWRLNNVQPWLARSMGEQVSRLGAVRPVLVAGHPSVAELRAGFKTKPSGIMPVSIHNVTCDRLCNQAAAEYTAALTAYGPATTEELHDDHLDSRLAPPRQLGLPV